MMDNIHLQIRTGNTNIWNQSWCKLWNSLHDRLNLQQTQYNIPNVIADLWIPGTKKWDTHKIAMVFDQELLHEILSLSVIPENEKDILCWKHTPSGICTSKSAYIGLAQEYATHKPPPQIPLPKLQMLSSIWKDKTIQPRINTFTWRLMRMALPTGDRVHGIINSADGLCATCAQPENDTHL